MDGNIFSTLQWTNMIIEKKNNRINNICLFGFALGLVCLSNQTTKLKIHSNCVIFNGKQLACNISIISF